ncbi:MAG: hypothetical protein JWM06_1378 [Actinomycetia bacterium]|jgi:hypothetical protein|nr:hypothetical protein [Actinomycetes bacterium]
MRMPIPRPWTASKMLVALLGIALAVATLCLVLLLAATPPFQCGTDYASPQTPLYSGPVAVFTLLFAAAALLVGVGLKLGLSRTSDDQPWATRTLVLATLLLFVGGGAVIADVGRWTCWP